MCYHMLCSSIFMLFLSSSFIVLVVNGLILNYAINVPYKQRSYTANISNATMYFNN